jgi:putative ABC transport system ATP-binding protein
LGVAASPQGDTFSPVTSAAPNPASASPCVFHVRGLTRTYGEGDAAVHALVGVDFDLCAGELVVLLGASGSGKSTLLNQLGGLDSPSSGTLLYRGDDIAGFDETALTQFRRDAVGFVFQAYNLIPSLTARENVALISEIARDPMTPEEALGLVGLAERMDHFPAQLSGASSSAWPLRARSRSAPKSCFAMNRPAL